MQIILSIAGILIGIIGVIFAVRERFLSMELRRTVERIEKWQLTQTWTKIGIVATVFDALDKAQTLVQERQSVDHEVLRKVESARRGTIDNYRILLQEAALAEPNFDMETIRKWKKAGKLENEWRVCAAMRLLPTKEITDNCENLRLTEHHD
jgi:hypothetical protein